MRVTAVSDLHGYLPEINPTDMYLICGDISPIDIQTNYFEMATWFKNVFIPYLKGVDAKCIVFIGGNHDFFFSNLLFECQYLGNNFERDSLIPALKKHRLTKKVHYLENSMYEYKGIKIYGCPYVENLSRWAFSLVHNKGVYDNIPPCDILLLHQPPYIDELGLAKFCGMERQLGSISLADKIRQIKPKYVFCGHVHSGKHDRCSLRFTDGETSLYNVAIKDEDYNVAYNPLVIDVDI